MPSGFWGSSPFLGCGFSGQHVYQAGVVFYFELNGAWFRLRPRSAGMNVGTYVSWVHRGLISGQARL